MEGVMKKLALWHTRTFRPIMTHDDLDPIMTALGFVAVPLITTAASTPHQENHSSSSSSSSSNGGGSSGASWKEYAYSPAAAKARPKKARSSPAKAEPEREQLLPPRPRLPSPRIDGLHLLTYRAFIDAVGFYIGTQRVADHFHVRGMPLHRVHDRVFDKVFRRMNDERRMTEDEGIFVFREGTLDQKTLVLCGSPNTTISSNSGNSSSSSSNSTAKLTCLVPLKDIILLKDIKV